MPQPYRIAILGIGGTAAKVLAELAADDSVAAGAIEIAVADTDVRALDRLQAPIVQIQLGRDWTHTNGCGGNVVLGEKAARTSLADVQQFLDGAAMAFVVCGLGGGTGTGAAKIVASLVRDLKINTLFMVTLPFAFEGNQKRLLADKHLDMLRELTPTVAPVPNDLLFTVLQANTPVEQAFEVANSLLAHVLSCFSRLPQASAILPVDFAAFREVLKDKPAICSLGVAQASGPDWREALQKQFLACPLLGGPDALQKANAALVMLVSGISLSIGELQGVLGAFQQLFPANANTLVGAYQDPLLQGEVQVVGLVCQFARKPGAPSAAPDGVLPGMNTPGNRIRTGADGKGAKGDGKGEVQGLLPLQEQALGIFANTGRNYDEVNHQNLDIPTFQRRGEIIEIGSILAKE